MLYLIKIDQLSLSRWKGKIDPTDCFIIAYIYNFVNSRSEKIHRNKKGYVWVHHKKLLDDMPLLDIGERSLTRRLKKLEDLGIIIKEKITTFYGSRCMYRFVDISEIHGAASLKYRQVYLDDEDYVYDEDEEIYEN